MSTFEPVLPAARPDLIAAARSAHVDVGGAAALLRTLAGPMPDGVPCEVVAWAWVVDPALGQVLLVDHPGYGSWRPPGGRAMPGEATIAAATRELLEETGVRGAPLSDRPALVDAHPGSTPDGRANHSFGFAHLFVADPSAPVVAEPGQAAGWFALDAPPERRSLRHWHRLLGGIELARAMLIAPECQES